MNKGLRSCVNHLTNTPNHVLKKKKKTTLANIIELPRIVLYSSESTISRASRDSLYFPTRFTSAIFITRNTAITAIHIYKQSIFNNFIEFNNDHQIAHVSVSNGFSRIFSNPSFARRVARVFFFFFFLVISSFLNQRDG